MAKKQPDKLSVDVAKARAAGLSYGQWKATQDPETVEEAIALRGMKACRYCGKLFKPKTTQLYCNIDCQYYARLARSRKEV